MSQLELSSVLGDRDEAGSLTFRGLTLRGYARREGIQIMFSSSSASGYLNTHTHHHHLGRQQQNSTKPRGVQSRNLDTLFLGLRGVPKTSSDLVSRGPHAASSQLIGALVVPKPSLSRRRRSKVDGNSWRDLGLPISRVGLSSAAAFQVKLTSSSVKDSQKGKRHHAERKRGWGGGNRNHDGAGERAADRRSRSVQTPHPEQRLKQFDPPATLEKWFCRAKQHDGG